MSQILIGMSQADITPPAPFSLRGQFHTRISKYVESPLYANVFAAESGGEQLILCACDLAIVPAEACEHVRGLVRERCPGIDVSKIVFSATHTHTGPNYFGSDLKRYAYVAAGHLPGTIRIEDEEELPSGVWSDDKCSRYISAILCDAVCRAWESRKPAFFSPSFGRAVVGHCRRVVYDDGSARMYGATDTANFDALEGGSDSGVELLYIFNSDKKPMGVLVNVACPSQCVETEYFVSSDFWGKARDRIHERLGGDFVVVGLCGAGGDQSPRDLVRLQRDRARRGDPDMFGLEGAAEIGGRIAGVVLDKLEDARRDMNGEAPMLHETLTVDFPLRTVSVSEYEQARRAIGDYVAKTEKDVYSVKEMSDLFVPAGVLERYEQQKRTGFYSAEIHVARLADIAFVTSPFELFLDFGNRIKARSAAAQTFIVNLACGVGIYLPTAKAERGGHYGANIASGITGREGGELLVRKSLDTLERMWSR